MDNSDVSQPGADVGFVYPSACKAFALQVVGIGCQLNYAGTAFMLKR